MYFLLTSNSEWSPTYLIFPTSLTVFLSMNIIREVISVLLKLKGFKRYHIIQKLLPAIWDKCLHLRKEYIMLFLPVILHPMEKVLLQMMNQKAKQQEGHKGKKVHNSKRDGEETKNVMGKKMRQDWN